MGDVDNRKGYIGKGSRCKKNPCVFPSILL